MIISPLEVKLTSGQLITNMIDRMYPPYPFKHHHFHKSLAAKGLPAWGIFRANLTQEAPYVKRTSNRSPSPKAAPGGPSACLTGGCFGTLPSAFHCPPRRPARGEHTASGASAAERRSREHEGRRRANEHDMTRADAGCSPRGTERGTATRRVAIIAVSAIEGQNRSGVYFEDYIDNQESR